MSSLALRLDKTGVCVHVCAYAPMLLWGSVESQPGSCRASEPAPEAGSRVEVGVTAAPWQTGSDLCLRPLTLPFCWEYLTEVKARLGDLNSLGLP